MDRVKVLWCSLWSLLAGVLLFVLPADARPQETATKLRTFYLQRDFEGGYRFGQEEGAWSSEPKVRAWFILNTARSDREDESLAAAEKLAQVHPENGWSWFALAMALNRTDGRNEEALGASEKALSLFPNHPDFLWMRAETLMRKQKPQDAAAFIDSVRHQVQNPAELLATKGNALFVLSSGTHDARQFEEALQLFAEARKIDPTNLSGYYLPGTYLNWRNRHGEALPLLEEALALSPNSLSVHEQYWRAVLGAKEMSREAKHQELEADIEAYLQRRSDSPRVLSAVTRVCRELKWEERLKQIEYEILTRFPDTPEAEWVLVERWRDFQAKFGSNGFEDPEKQSRYQEMLRAFIDRPTHHNENVLGEAYRQLFYSIRQDTSVRPEVLLEVVQGMVQYEKLNPHVAYAEGATVLAQRTPYLEEAAEIARKGFEAGRARLERQRSFYDSEEDYQRSLDWMMAQMHDALGWVLFKAGRLEEAEQELLQAHTRNSEYAENLCHLGQLYESLNDVNQAEAYYIKGLAVQTMGENPNAEALKRLYQKRHGSLQDFDQYFAQIEAQHKERRKADILAQRIADPKPAAPFRLKTPDASETGLEVFSGKIVVINFWGTWCGPCVREMPEFQELHEKYRDDPEVAILTINNDRNPDDVPQWMQKHNYNFTVLIDDGYVGDIAGVRAFPTTWFLDERGRIVFSKRGYTKELLEEFSWRIEALREEKRRAQK